MIFWIIVGVTMLGAAAFMLLPALRGRDAARDRASYDMQVYRDQLREVDADRSRGLLSKAEAEASRTEISRKLLAADTEARQGAQNTRAPRYVSRLMAALAALVLIGGGAGVYATIGGGGRADMPLEPRLAELRAARAERPSQEQAEARMAQAQTSAPALAEEDAELIDGLAEKLKSRPDDIRGHALLARSLATLGRFAEARAAQARVVELHGAEVPGEDLVALAELSILAAGGYVSPQAETALRRASETIPEDPLLRYYSGLAMLQAGRADLAYPLWLGVMRQGPADAPWVQAISRDIAEVARLAGEAPPQIAPPSSAPGPSAANIEAAGEMSAEDRAGMIEGMVRQLGTRLAEEGGTAAEWARLIRALGVLGRTDEAADVLAEARTRFAEDPAALAEVEAAAP